MKAFHDKYICRKTFELNQKVWLLNSQLKLFPRKLRSRWDGPFKVIQVFNHGAVEIHDPKTGNTFRENGQCLKPYIEGIFEEEIIEKVSLTDLQ